MESQRGGSIMITLVIRKSDNKVMPLRQNSPGHKTGQMAKNVAKKFGGNVSGYKEFVVDPADEAAVMGAKEIEYDPVADDIIITPFTAKERGLADKEAELEATEEELIRAYNMEQGASALTIATARYAARRAALQAKLDRIKQDIEDLENL
jgi:hypothetical protein